MVVRAIMRKKIHEKVKELLKSLRENNAAEKPGLNIDNVNDLGEATAIVIGQTEAIKSLNKKTIVYVAKQGQILK